MASSPKNSLRHIQKNRLFVGSGVEETLDGNLHTALDEFGQYAIDYDGANKRVSKVVYNSEKSKNEDKIAESAFSATKGIRHNNKFGYYLDLYVGHVKAAGFRKGGSSGGFVSWVACAMMDQGLIDGFIHVKKATDKKVLFEYAISRSPAEIRAGAKSRYYPVELSKVLKEVKKTAGRYAVVGIPEIITELRLLAEQDEIVGDRIKYYFGLVAGHQKTTKYAEAIGWEYGIKPGDLEDIDFRVKRDSGLAIQYDMRVTGKINGERRVFVVPSVEPFVHSWAHGFFKARFSDFTDNSFNEVADITFGDAWLDEYVGDPAGNNILIVRDPVIAEVIRKGIKNGSLQLDVVDEETIIRSQQGLIHHTRDELPYRLHKEAARHGWAPYKRVDPSGDLDEHRKRVQDVRQAIAEKSHKYYQDAIKKNDFEVFRKKMQPYVDEYNRLYGHTIPKKIKSKNVKADGAIVTLSGYFNYGNVVQRFALQEFLRQHGHTFVSYLDDHSGVSSVHKVRKVTKLKTPLRAVLRFARQSRPYWYVPTVADIYPDKRKNANLINFVNKNIFIRQFYKGDTYKTYIVGSDQVWRNWWGDRSRFGYYFLDFLRGRDVRRVAYAASFGKDDVTEVMSTEDAQYIRPYLEQFDSISVREKSGVKIIKETWGIDGAVQVLDPTLLLNASDYARLIDTSSERSYDMKPIFTYIIDENPQINGFISRISEHRGQQICSIRAHGGAESDVLPPVERWLKGFRDADLVITNSFHGMMLSIVNKTDFVIIGKESGGLARIKDFLHDFNLQDRFIEESELKAFKVEDLQSIDWKAVDLVLREKVKASGDWLLKSVS